MEIASFCDGSYALDTPNASAAICRNLYPEIIEKGQRQGKLRLRQIPGLSLFQTLPTAPLRALWSSTVTQQPTPGLPLSQGFAIGGNTLYQIFVDPNQAPVPIGVVGNGRNPAIITSNGFQLAIASAGAGYIAPGGGEGVQPIVDNQGNPVDALTIAFLDQYLIAGIVNTKQIMVSNLAPNGGIWDPADVALKEGYADNVVRIWVDQPGGTYVFVLGAETTEVWQDTGGLFPFGRVAGQVYPIGCDSASSVAGAGGFRAWYWRGIVWGCRGFQPQRISDFGVEQAILGYPTDARLNCEGWMQLDRGHVFYVLTFPGYGTWVYDESLKTWHERLYFSNGAYSQYRARVYTRFQDLDLVGDYQSGKIFRMDPTVYTDADGALLRRERICPYISDSLKNDRYNRFSLDMDTGIGLSVPSTQLGYDPQVILRYSIDRGKTWSNERQQSAGKIGETNKRVFWPQCGSSRIGWVPDVIMTDPVPMSINAAYLDIGLGQSPGNRPTS
jgi:hypothetical protein